MRRRATFVLPLLLASIIAIGLGITQFSGKADAASAILYHPSADCSTKPATITLNWTPLASATSQWLEISLQDNGFEDGTFTHVSLRDRQTSYSMAALARDIPSYWRIVSSTKSGDVASQTRTFVPCDAPFLLWGPMRCRDFTTATVEFHWAPVANYEGEQWIEFDSNGDWTGSDYWQVGPLSPSLENQTETGFQDGVGYFFRIVHVVNGKREVSSVGWFKPDCTPHVNPNNYPTNDRLIVPSIGVDAPVNIRDVGLDGVLGVPNGADDVVRYNFAYFSSFQGQIGGPGPTLIAGHLDYYVVGPAVFWNLAKMKQGDVIQYWSGDTEYKYVVDWVAALPYNQPLNSYFQDSSADTLMLITCYGVFNRSEYGGYNERTLVHAVRQY